MAHLGHLRLLEHLNVDEVADVDDVLVVLGWGPFDILIHRDEGSGAGCAGEKEHQWDQCCHQRDRPPTERATVPHERRSHYA